MSHANSFREYSPYCEALSRDDRQVCDWASDQGNVDLKYFTYVKDTDPGKLVHFRLALGSNLKRAIDSVIRNLLTPTLPRVR